MQARDLYLLPITLVLLLIGSGSARALLPIPHPDLASLPPQMQQTLRPAIEYFERNAQLVGDFEKSERFGGLAMHYHAHRLAAPAEVAYENALELAPSDFRWNYYLGYLYEETQRPELAVQLYRRALAAEPSYLPAFIRLGNATLATGDLDSAEVAYRTILEASASEANALTGLGRVLAERGRHQEAIPLFRRALEAQPNADQVYRLLERSFLAIGDEAAAADARARSGEQIIFGPDPVLGLMSARRLGAGPFLRRGVEALQAGQPAQAIDALRMATSIDPMNLDARGLLANTLRSNGEQTEGEAILRATLEFEPGHSDTIFALSDLLIEAGRPSEAADVLATAVRADADISIFAALADALMLAGRFEEAASLYVQMGDLARPPGTEVPDPYYLAGIALQATDRCRLATDAFALAYARNPPNPIRAQALIRTVSACSESTTEQKAQALSLANNIYVTLPSQGAAEVYAMALAANQHFADAVDLQTQALFEALRDGLIDSNPQLQENMQRYRNEQVASTPWPVGHSIYTTTISSLIREREAALAEEAIDE